MPCKAKIFFLLDGCQEHTICFPSKDKINNPHANSHVRPLLGISRLRVARWCHLLMKQLKTTPDAVRVKKHS